MSKKQKPSKSLVPLFVLGLILIVSGILYSIFVLPQQMEHPEVRTSIYGPSITSATGLIIVVLLIFFGCASIYNGIRQAKQPKK